jgi:amidase
MAFNVAGWPGVVVRCGESSTGLPIAVQVVAAPWREDIALRVALSLEEAMGGWKAPELCGAR